MRELWPYLKAVGRIWWALMSCAVFTLLSIFAVATHRNDTWQFVASVALAVVMFFVAGYEAWRKEYRANIQGPEILLQWKSKREDRDEEVTFRNSGTADAIDVKLEEFSGPGLNCEMKWTHEIEIPLIPVGESRSVTPSYFYVVNESWHIGKVWKLLESASEDRPVWLWITYRNSRGTRYRQRFLLRQVSVAREREISCRPDKLEVTR